MTKEIEFGDYTALVDIEGQLYRIHKSPQSLLTSYDRKAISELVFRQDLVADNERLLARVKELEYALAKSTGHIRKVIDMDCTNDEAMAFRKQMNVVLGLD